MKFEVRHELDAPLAAIEAAMMSRQLAAIILERMPKLASIEPLVHSVDESEFVRCWRYQARAPLRILERYDITREMMTWDEHFAYVPETRTAHWFICPLGDDSENARWRKYFHARGRYALSQQLDGRTQRVVNGALDISAGVMGSVIERVAMREVRRTYAAEADSLQNLARAVKR